MYHIASGLLYYLQEKYAESTSAYHTVTELNPGFAPSYWRLFRLYLVTGDTIQAVNNLKKFMELDPTTKHLANEVPIVYQNSGIQELYHWLFEAESSKSNRNAHSLMTYCCLAGNKEEAFKWLELAVLNRQPEVLYLMNNPDCKILFSDPRFQDFAKQITPGITER